MRLGRVLPIFVALVAALLALRLTPRGGSADDAGYLAYRVPVGHPLTFRVDPGDGDLAVTLHLEAPHFDRGGTPLRFPVATALLAADGSTIWAGRALVDASPGGAVADRADALTAARVMSLPAATVPAGAHLRVTVEPGADATEGAHAVIRLLPRRAAMERPGDDVQLVHVRPLPRPPAVPPAPDAPGELIARDHAAAWTVRGPGAVRLEVLPLGDGAALDLATVDNLGRSTSVGLWAAPGAQPHRVDAPGGGAITVTARCTTPDPCARVRAFVENGAAPLGDAVTPDAAGEVTPDRRRLPVWRVAAGDPPVRATLAGDGTARISARPVAGPATVTWRLLNCGRPGPAWPKANMRSGIGREDAPSAHRCGRPISSGELAIPFRPAPFERAAGNGTAAEPIAFLAAAFPGATLELRAAAGNVDLAFEAPDDPPAPRLTPAYEVPLDRVRLRHAPYLRRRWVPFRPDDHARLVSIGRAVDVEAQVRLEPAGPGTGGGPYVVIVPLPPRTRQILVEELDDRPDGWIPFYRTAFATGETAEVIVPAAGDRAGRMSLDYLVPPAALGGSLRVWLDGTLRAERRLGLTRGRIRLEDLPSGRHDLRVEGAPGMVFTGTSTTGLPWAERAVWRLDRGASLTVPVRLGGGAKTLHVVLYADQPHDGPPPRATVVIDEGRRVAAVRAAGGRTRLVRELNPTPLPVRAVWLDRAGGPRSRAHFAVRLAPDLGPGTHLVRVTLDDGPGRAYARFYVTGAAAEPTVERLGTEWDLD